MPWSEKQSLQFRWEVFNVTNSVRFDVQSSLLSGALTLDSGQSFGELFGPADKSAHHAVCTTLRVLRRECRSCGRWVVPAPALRSLSRALPPRPFRDRTPADALPRLSSGNDAP